MYVYWQIKDLWNNTTNSSTYEALYIVINTKSTHMSTHWDPWGTKGPIPLSVKPVKQYKRFKNQTSTHNEQIIDLMETRTTKEYKKIINTVSLSTDLTLI